MQTTMKVFITLMLAFAGINLGAASAVAQSSQIGAASAVAQSSKVADIRSSLPQMPTPAPVALNVNQDGLAETSSGPLYFGYRPFKDGQTVPLGSVNFEGNNYRVSVHHVQTPQERATEGRIKFDPAPNARLPRLPLIGSADLHVEVGLKYRDPNSEFITFSDGTGNLYAPRPELTGFAGICLGDERYASANRTFNWQQQSCHGLRAYLTEPMDLDPRYGFLQSSYHTYEIKRQIPVRDPRAGAMAEDYTAGILRFAADLEVPLPTDEARPDSVVGYDRKPLLGLSGAWSIYLHSWNVAPIKEGPQFTIEGNFEAYGRKEIGGTGAYGHLLLGPGFRFGVGRLTATLRADAIAPYYSMDRRPIPGAPEFERGPQMVGLRPYVQAGLYVNIYTGN